MKARATKIAEGVYWVGVIDWDIRKYHGYTLRGTTYNAYLIFGNDTVALVDNAYPGMSAQLWARIKDAFEQEGRGTEPTIDVIVQNHVEKDHSGALPELTSAFPGAPIYCTEVAIRGLQKHYPSLADAPFTSVKTAETIDLGGRTLTFFQAALLHWPDSMFTFLEDEKLLFSNDAFGQHVCSTRRFDRDIPTHVLMDAAQKFYANLLTPQSKILLKKFDEIRQQGLLDKIQMIAPSHGQVWTDPTTIVNAYMTWATGQCKHKATIVFDTMHHSTQLMAHSLAEGLMSKGMDVAMYFLHEDERSDIVKDILDSKAVLFGIPTIYDEPYPSIGDLIYYLKGLRFDRTGYTRTALAFGSHGGRGGAITKLSQDLTACGFSVLDGYELFYVPDDNELLKCYEIGESIAAIL